MYNISFVCVFVCLLVCFPSPWLRGQCVSSNPIVIVDFAGLIAENNYAWGNRSTDNEAVWVAGEVSEDLTTITYNMGAMDLDPFYSEAEDNYYWHFHVWADNCATAYTWDDDFFQVVYIDDEGTMIDLSAFDIPHYTHGPDTGVCREYTVHTTAGACILYISVHTINAQVNNIAPPPPPRPRSPSRPSLCR